MSNKKIEINPALFSIGKSAKTKKNRERKMKPTTIPLISPNFLKNKLLKRIKEYKNKETENLENNSRKLPENVITDTININSYNNNNNAKSKEQEVVKYTDEFNESIEYLQSISQSKKTNNEQNIYNRQQDKIRRELQQKTLRKPLHYQGSGSGSNLQINLDLPDELKEPLQHVNTDHLTISQEPIQLNLLNDNVPYGILKGGLKPTFREWNKTQKIYIDNPNHALVVDTKTLNNPDIEREYRLNMLKDKIKHKKQLNNQVNNQVVIPKLINSEKNPQITNNFDNDIDKLMMTRSLINKPIMEQNYIVPVTSNLQTLQSNNSLSQTLNRGPISSNNTGINSNMLQHNTPMNVKRIIKRTIHKKYTLGKSKIQKTVAVLLKDNQTRKKVLQACKDLKKKPISDVKKYLREHNLIKIGSNAPTDVIRKLYESAMLAGEITNNNKDTLLHNFMKTDESHEH